MVDAALAVLKPGVSALELCRAAIAANDGVRPWIEHFYLAHGVGTESAEMPLIGTDFGERFDEQLIMEPGMVIVFEPVIWEEGAADTDRKTLWPLPIQGGSNSAARPTSHTACPHEPRRS